MRRGDKITVARQGFELRGDALRDKPWFLQAHVMLVAGGRLTYTYGLGNAGHAGTVGVADRGIEWVRGWEGPEVDALKVVAALSSRV